MSHLRQYCENCATYDTPQWRTGWYSDVLGRPVLLCNACGLKYHKNQFCPYCFYVYGNREHNKTFNTWLTCTKCDRMVHVDCEAKYAGGHSQSHNYVCPTCVTGKTPVSSPLTHYLSQPHIHELQNDHDHSDTHSHTHNHTHNHIHNHPQDKATKFPSLHLPELKSEGDLSRQNNQTMKDFHDHHPNHQKTFASFMDFALTHQSL